MLTDKASGIYRIKNNIAILAVLTLFLCPLFSRAQLHDVSFNVGGSTFTMVAVKGGTFQMGARLDIDEEADDDELPAHTVEVGDFLIGRHEVTQSLWTAVMGSNPSYFQDGRRPVECVSWEDCMTFISRLNAMTGKNFRLPTEAEWEYAAKGGHYANASCYSGSDDISDVAWWAGNAGNALGGGHPDYGTHSVGRKYGNQLGIYDMTGNVDEWCSDKYDADYYRHSAKKNPRGAHEGTEYVVRGGGWNYAAKSCRVTNRDSNFPNYSNNNLGLRLALDADCLTADADTDADADADAEDPDSIREETQNQQTSYDWQETYDDEEEDAVVAPVLQTHEPETKNTKENLAVRAVRDREVNVKGIRFTMKAVGGGNFTQGATSDQGGACENDEKPAHKVFLRSFLIGETEVTQELWQIVMGSNPSRFVGINRPVERVSWNACQVFIQKLNALTGLRFRLPTEAEWEYAARGGNKSRQTKYAGSNDLSNIAWWQTNSGSSTHQVAQKQPNELGLYDMSGNVWEWCNDRYAEKYYSMLVEGTDGMISNPEGPKTGTNRVCRGGGWFFGPTFCRNAFRFNFNPADSSYYIGLRLALDAE